MYLYIHIDTYTRHILLIKIERICNNFSLSFKTMGKLICGLFLHYVLKFHALVPMLCGE